MTTLAITGARAAGQSFLNVAGNMAMAYASSQISRAFDNRVFEGPRLENFHLLTSRDGAAMPVVYGRMRLGGQVIWASRLKETSTKSSIGGKGGGPTQVSYSYSISFAIGLCEGPIEGVDRIWVNGSVLATEGLTWRLYKGEKDQMPDPLIEAIDGPDVPAFRETAYMVFEDFPLDDYGARLPQFSAEVIAAPEPGRPDEPRLETMVRGVNLLPSSGEFAYATEIFEDLSGPRAHPVNMNNLTGKPDLELALDQLETQLPNCKHVNIIMSWFGDDLRANHCTLRPGIEHRDRIFLDEDWQVCGKNRDNAYQVSRDKDDRPIYGGTPSDNSIVQAVKSLKARGFTVGFYPFILMDVPPENGLPNPYGGSGQPAFPWRGRITSSADKTATAQAHISSFMGQTSVQDFSISGEKITCSSSDKGFARFILHYAHLAKLSGGVDRFIIGSEMRGLTYIRGAGGTYPMVSALKTLAAQVRQVVGPNTGLTYAADWSEYFGHQPADAPGDLIYHLDPLWADTNIDFVGIDFYVPLSDWRDDEVHLDQSLTDSPYDISYLKSGVEGGEDYDWYYASSADRAAQTRSSITQWQYRYKDLRNWWANPHENSISGVKTATVWQAQSKPIWLSEIGCPAIDKGANQPNVFVDLKSSENHEPYFSSGLRDDLMQRRYIEALLGYWMDEGINPVSTVTGLPMIDMDTASVWCWDARPFPDFPARENVWGDGRNWQLGHWLTGRMGYVLLADIIEDICKRCWVKANTDKVSGLVQGYILSCPMAGRAPLSALMSLYGVRAAERGDEVHFISHGLEPKTVLRLGDLTFQDRGVITEIYPDRESCPLDLRLHYIDMTRDYQPAIARARNDDSDSLRIIDISAPLVLDQAGARQLAKAELSERLKLRQIKFGLSPARMDVEIGDLVALPDVFEFDNSKLWLVSGIDAGTVLASEALDKRQVVAGGTPESPPSIAWAGRPELKVLDVPDISKSGGRAGPLIGVRCVPFNAVTISGADQDISLTKSAAWGNLLSPLSRGPIAIWDRAGQLDIFMPGRELASQGRIDVLGGANRFAVQTDAGWEILQARNIELTGPNTYRLSLLLRGLAGTDADMMDIVPAGREVVWLDEAWQDLPLSTQQIDADMTLTASAAGRTSYPITFTYQARHLRPLSPCHLKLEKAESGDVNLHWIRRTRQGGDGWGGVDVPLGEDSEIYRAEFFEGQTLLASFETAQPQLPLSAAQWQSLSTASHISVRQGSQIMGWGPAGQLDL